MRYVMVLIVVVTSVMADFVVHDQQFEAGVVDPSLSTQATPIRVSGFGFLGFNVEDDTILSTFFSQDTNDLEPSATDVGLVGDFLVAPAPVRANATSYLCYRLGSDQPVSIYIYNRRGQIVHQYDSQAGNSNGGAAGYNRVAFSIFSKIPTGLYFAFLKVKGNIVRTRFEVQR